MPTEQIMESQEPIAPEATPDRPPDHSRRDPPAQTSSSIGPRRADLRSPRRRRHLRRQAGRAQHHARHRPQPHHGPDRALGLREEHADPLLQPDERPDPEREGRRLDPLPRPGPLRRGRRSGRGPQADRHGVPEAEPVPEVDLRQHRLRAACDRDEGRHGRHRRAGSDAGGAVGRGQGPAEGERLSTLGRPAAAAVHRALPGRRAGRDPDGRAVLGARPDRDLAASRT